MRLLEIAGNFKRGPEWDCIRDIRVRGGIVYDLRVLPIPFIEDNTYDGTASDHFIEHLTKEEGIAFFKEMQRVLKPGGTIRMVWPSMNIVDEFNSNKDLSQHPFVKMYNEFIIDREHPFKNPYYNSIMPYDQIMLLSKQKKAALRLMHQEGEHKHLWYVKELIDTLKELGFNNVQECQYGNSTFTPFNGIDRRDEMRKAHSSIIEATK